MYVLDEARSKLVYAIGMRLIPDLPAMDQVGRWRFIEIIDELLGSRPPALQRQLLLFLALVRHATIPLARVRFERAPPDVQDRVLTALQDSANPLFRRGLWGLKTLIFMGYYGQERVSRTLGYSPVRNGNAVLKQRSRGDHP